jgi:hypothetical protein
MVQPFKKVRNALTTHLIVYVPSTNGNFESRIDETQKFLTHLFGGTTEEGGVGTYVGKKRKVIKEDVAKVEVFTTPAVYEKKKDGLLKWLKGKKKAWRQEELAVEYEEDMFWV